MRKALLIVLLLFLIPGTAFGGAVRQTVPTELNHFAFDLHTGASGIARVVKTDIKHPGFFYAYYLRPGEIYQAPFQASSGRFELDFAFWDPGSYEVRLEVPGQPAQVQTVQVGWSGAQYARTIGILTGLLAFGLLVGYVSYTLPRPSAAVTILVLLFALAPRAWGSGKNDAARIAGEPRAYGTATLAFDLPDKPHDVELVFRHAEDDLDLVRSKFRVAGPVQFSYLFPEGAPYQTKITAAPVGGGTPVEREHLLEVAAAQPTNWERWRGWLLGTVFFLAGGACGLWLGKQSRRGALAGT